MSNEDVEIRVFGSPSVFGSADADDESRVADVVRTHVLPDSDAEYHRVNVRILRRNDGTPDHLVAYLLRKDVYLAEVVRVDLGENYDVVRTTWHYDTAAHAADEDGDADGEPHAGPGPAPEAVPEAAYAVDFVVGTPVPEILSAKKLVDDLTTMLKSLGFTCTTLVGTAATVAAYQAALTSHLKGFVNVGHGFPGGLILSDGVLDATWFAARPASAVSPSVVYFNSCEVHNPPLQPAVLHAGARTFVGGITDLLIGASEKVCACFWAKALKTSAEMAYAVHQCERDNYPTTGAHGISGDRGPYVPLSPIVYTKPIHLDGNPLFVRQGTADYFHGLRWAGSLAGGFPDAPDGPVLFGFGGGSLGIDQGPDARKVALTWDADQTVVLHGRMHLDGHGLYVRQGVGDLFHGLRWSGSPDGAFPGAPDGPVLFGFGGGSLGIDQGLNARKVALTWDTNRTVHVTGDLYVDGAIHAKGFSAAPGTERHADGDGASEGRLALGGLAVAWGHGCIPNKTGDYSVPVPAGFSGTPVVMVAVDVGREDAPTPAGTLRAGAVDGEVFHVVYSTADDDEAAPTHDATVEFAWLALGVRTD